MAKCKFEGRKICRDNLDYLKEDKSSGKYLAYCVKELGVMKNCNVQNDLSLYDILQMHKDRKKLVTLVQSDDFVEAFKLSQKRVSKSIKRYEDDLDDLFEKALKKKNTL